jgi:peroxiredoxin
MNTHARVTVGLAALSFLAIAPAARADSKLLALGEKAPLAATKMKTHEGKDVSIAEVAKDKGTLVFFTCNHCPYAKAWESRLVAIGNAAQKQGIGVIAINSNDPNVKGEDGMEEMQTRAKTTGMTFPYAVDATSDIARAFGATKTPEVFLFDKAGKLVYLGAIDDNAYEADKVKDKYLQTALDALVAGKPIANAQTKSLGCGIKFREKKS